MFVLHFLQNSCDINAENDMKRTALHVAAIEGNCNVIEKLVGFGADLNRVDKDGNTPLHVVFIKKTAKPLTNAPQITKVLLNLKKQILYICRVWRSEWCNLPDWLL